MSRSILVVSLLAFGVLQTGVSGQCPSGDPNEVLCEDFDTYCVGGGYPGDPACATGATPDNAKLREVWLHTSNYEGGTGCGSSAIIVDNAEVLNTPGVYNASSVPFAGRWPGSNTEYLVQTTFRDWVLSSPGNEVLDLHRIIRAKYGDQYDALTGTDTEPLVLSFAMASDVPGKILYSDGYLELAYGLPTKENRANTDFVWSPACISFCSPTLKQGPFPIMCAQGNPQAGGEDPLPAGCPANPSSTAPVRNAIAIGLLAMLRTDACGCNEPIHGGYSDHPAYFDGQVWWKLVHNNPRPSSGTVTPLDGASMPPPSDIHEPGDFLLWHDPLTGSGGTPAVGGPHNWIKLTVKSSTVKIEMTTIETSKLVPGAKYQVYNVMDNVPRNYFGPFNTLRGGVGPGCQLASNASWDTCASGTTRTCVPPLLEWPAQGGVPATVTRGNQSRWVDFDDILLAGPPYSVKGACCLSDGGCVDDKLEGECPAGSEFRGENTTCANDAAVCKGACCTQTDCQDGRRISECAAGEYLGYGSTCAQGCPCSDPFADVDGDGDVDQADFAVFQICFGGTDSGICKCFDRTDGTGSGPPNHVVDLYDWDKFEACASGAGIPLDPNCDQ